ncbi:MAG: transcriptional regulator NrdR [Actinomycetota bacterium]
MRCPACDNDGTRVVDSRAVEEGAVIRRRRACESCTHRFTTFERFEVMPLRVLKRSGCREPFDGQKLRGGLVSAAKGRPITDEMFDDVVDGIEDEARAHGAGEVTSEWLGLAVLDRLRTIDHVTCLRFASVYKGFTDVGDFEREVRLIKLDAGS